MGFYRQPASAVIDHAKAAPIVVEFIREHEIATLLREADPFGCDDPCPGNPAGHYPIRSAGDLVCAHCEKVFWR